MGRQDADLDGEADFRCLCWLVHQRMDTHMGSKSGLGIRTRWISASMQVLTGSKPEWLSMELLLHWKPLPAPVEEWRLMAYVHLAV